MEYILEGTKLARFYKKNLKGKFCILWIDIAPATFCYIHFCYKIELIFYPRVRNSTTHLTLIHNQQRERETEGKWKCKRNESCWVIWWSCLLTSVHFSSTVLSFFEILCIGDFWRCKLAERERERRRIIKMQIKWILLSYIVNTLFQE